MRRGVRCGRRVGGRVPRRPRQDESAGGGGGWWRGVWVDEDVRGYAQGEQRGRASGVLPRVRPEASQGGARVGGVVLRVRGSAAVVGARIGHDSSTG